MIVQQIIRSALLLLALGSLAVWGVRELKKPQSVAEKPVAENLPVIEGHQVIMTYFLSGIRCVSCKKIEAITREAAAKTFPDEIASGKLVFRVINTEEPPNKHHIAHYRLTSKSVIISHRLDGMEIEWANMPKVWELIDDVPAFHAYLGRQIRTYLDS